MNRANVKIMTVDDDEFMRRIVNRLLTTLGYQRMKEVDSGEAALGMLDKLKQPPDVIILDLKMPGMDGIEFVRYLVERNFPGQLILISGEDERLLRSAQNLVAAHNIPVLGCLTKPLDAKALDALLTTLVKKPLVETPEEHERLGADDLRRAIEQGELFNHYQPIITLAEGELAGLEVLVRWQHPELGLLMPDSFITLAEDEDLIDDLTRAVVAMACKQFTLWRDQGLHCPMAINLSMENLDKLAFADWITKAVADAGLQPWDLLLEVTESRPMRRPHITLDNLIRLRLKGFRLAVDDFGTGHASLAQVRDIPFDQFKLDRSFVHGACSDRRISVMFDSALNLARELDLEITAEGVENREDWDYLRQHACHKAQGYFISRPMAAEAVLPWLEQWHERVRSELFPHLQGGVFASPETDAGTDRGPVLIVEDNDFQRKVQARILREEGFEPVHAANGQEAMEHLRHLRPTLILIDIEMPGISGLELLRRLRKTRIFAKTPVLVISGINTKNVVQDSMAAGANSFMVKPYNRKTLIERVHRALGNQ
ncbi:EAL domain-containing protein [Marinimicrobium sp. C2-29]|uniref:EAL domain-containing protein n=1 Tax=Marinimicrobium sp. C2-29 TaxID=3139825 RepID=UPI00313904D0